MRLRLFAAAACLALLTAAPGFAANGQNAPATDDSRADKSFVATVLDTTGGSMTLKKETGEVLFLSYDEPGLTVKIDKGVVKGSRVKVSVESTSMSRTLFIQLAPAS